MSIQIKVFNGVSSMNDNQRVFERIVDVNENISVPFENILSTLQFLYPGSIVQFNIQNH